MIRLASFSLEVLNRPFPNRLFPLFPAKEVSVLRNHENVFRLQVDFHANQNSFSNEKFSTKAHFETEAQGPT